MAINYLAGIDLNQNELIHGVIENQPNDAAAGTGAEGQLYYDTTLDTLKVWAGGSWEEVGAGVTTVTTTDGTYINLTPNSATSGAVTVTADLSAVDGTAISTTRFLDKNNKWSVPDYYTSFTAAGDTGTPQPITSGNTLTIAGSVGIDTVAGFDTVTVNLDLTELNTATTLNTSTDYIVISDNGANGKILPGNITLDQWGDAAANVDFGGNKLLDVATGTLGTDGVNLAQVQSLVAGVGVFQGGYNATTNSPALNGTSNVALNQGDFFVVTTGGNFFTKTVEVGDLIFANSNIPASSFPTLSDYTVVIADQNIAGAGSTDGGTQKGVAGFDSANFAVSANGWVQIKDNGVILGTETTGNYVATITEGTGIDVTGSGTESAAVQVTLDLNELTVSTTPKELAGNDSFGNTRKFTMATVANEIAAATGYSGLIGGSTSITIDDEIHELGTDSSSFMIQLVEVSSGNTVFADVNRGFLGAVTISFGTAPAANSIRVLIQKIG